jgi:hypothetical protein
VGVRTRYLTVERILADDLDDNAVEELICVYLQNRHGYGVDLTRPIGRDAEVLVPPSVEERQSHRSARVGDEAVTCRRGREPARRCREPPLGRRDAAGDCLLRPC